MTDQTDVREFLHRMANEAGFTPVEPGPVVRKARRRLARTVGGTLLMAGALVAGAFVAANGLMNAARTQMPQPAGQPTPTTTENGEARGEFTERFESPLHGLSIGYPSRWRTRAATEPWRGGDVAFGAPDVDVIFHPTFQDDLYFLAVASEELGAPWSQSWGDGAVSRLGAVPVGGWVNCPEASGGASERGAMVDGVVGVFESCISRFVAGYVVAVETATRGYVIYLHVEGERRVRTYDSDWFEAALETVDLHPEDALDALNPSESP
ncbi:MAG TPA: hypothetical protein VE915_02135 [Actinomycetota bacterium]|jgi:hypothetical protein|nr:hypothetical protein [Actinomycetota bacterium]